MAKNTNVQSVEPNVADLVNGWLKAYKLDYKLEQESLNTEIDQALNDYFSKNGGKGGNRPDAKLLLHANDGKYYPVLIEYKGYKERLVKLDAEGNVANKTSKNQPDFTNINSYAVNGAVHYSNAVLHYTSYTDVIAIGVTGYKDTNGKLKHLIGVYYVSKTNFGVGQKVDEYTDLSFLKKEHFSAFIEKVKQLSLPQDEIEKLKERREQEITASLVKLNNDIFKSEKGLSENDRVYLVVASIMATLGDVDNNVYPLTKADLKSSNQIPGNIPFVMAGITNTGVVNYVSNPVASFPKNSITIDIFGNTFYRDYPFGAGDDTGVYWNDSVEYSRGAMLFFAVAMQKALNGKFSYGKKLRSSQSFHFKMRLPIKGGKIDFDFMESFIAELEAQRVAELEAQRVAELSAYLTVSGYDNYELSTEELDALRNYSQLEWKIFNLEALFGKATRGKRLKSDDRIVGQLPFVTAGETSEGISAYIGNDVEVFEKNTTTIDMFGSAKYRNYKYGADDHIAVVHTENILPNASIFITSAIHKAAHTGEFHYGHNFYAKDADALNIMLPTKNGTPDYAFMETLISAIKKLVIKDVVLYSDQKIVATKAVVAQKSDK